MQGVRFYVREHDGTIWTEIEGFYRRPATVEELEGFCLEMRAALGPPASGAAVERTQVAVAA